MYYITEQIDVVHIWRSRLAPVFLYYLRGINSVGSGSSSISMVPGGSAGDLDRVRVIIYVSHEIDDSSHISIAAFVL